MGHKNTELEILEIICKTNFPDKSLELLDNGRDRENLSLPLAKSTINKEDTVFQPITPKI